MIFSASKHCGLAGTRFGWGLFKDKELANQVYEIMIYTMAALPEDSMLRTFNTIDQVLSKLCMCVASYCSYITFYIEESCGFFSFTYLYIYTRTAIYSIIHNF